MENYILCMPHIVHYWCFTSFNKLSNDLHLSMYDKRKICIKPKQDWNDIDTIFYINQKDKFQKLKMMNIFQSYSSSTLVKLYYLLLLILISITKTIIYNYPRQQIIICKTGQGEQRLWFWFNFLPSFSGWNISICNDNFES